MQCKKCGNPTNHKTGICIACNFDREFGPDVRLSSPARTPSKAAKSTQGDVKGHTGSVLSQNPYLLDDLELLLNAQISHIFSLVKEGKLELATHRINITNEAVKNAKR